jgi:hypothetical protein
VRLIYAASGVSWSETLAAEIVKSSPAETARAAERSSEPKNVPAEEADHHDTCVYVSVVETDVHVTSAELVIVPSADAAENVTAWRTVLAAADVAPAAPGSAR